MENDYVINVGNWKRMVFEPEKKLDKLMNVGPFLDILYCGLYDNERFSISLRVLSDEYPGFSPNIFYHKDKKQIELAGREFKVTKITPDELVLQYIGKAQRT